MNISASTSTSPYTPFASPYSRRNVDRDVLAQRALLGEDAYLSELESPSPLATPSPMIKQLSPLTVASHLQDNLQHNPFLDDYDDAGREPYSAVAVTPPKQHSVKRDAAYHQRSTLRSSSTMTSISSGLGLEIPIEVDRVSLHKEQTQGARQASRRQAQSVNLESASAMLPTIQETHRASSSSPTNRRRTKPSTMNTYSLPPSADLQTPTWRRPSVFPLGPVPPSLPPRRARYEPPPHIVDVAVERFNINTRTISSASPSALDQERQRQWQQWEAERVRSLQMTREAAKNNRVQAPSSSTSSSNRTTSSTSEVKTPASKSKKSRGKWWCFGAGAVESDHEEVDEKTEKQQYSNQRRRSVSSLDEVDVDEEVEEEDWNEARAASGAGLLSNFGFSCAKSNSRPRATLKKKMY